MDLRRVLLLPPKNSGGVVWDDNPRLIPSVSYRGVEPFPIGSIHTVTRSINMTSSVKVHVILDEKSLVETFVMKHLPHEGNIIVIKGAKYFIDSVEIDVTPMEVSYRLFVHAYRY